jgi:hypothetical protein
VGDLEVDCQPDADYGTDGSLLGAVGVTVDRRGFLGNPTCSLGEAAGPFRPKRRGQSKDVLGFPEPEVPTVGPTYWTFGPTKGAEHALRNRDCAACCLDRSRDLALDRPLEVSPGRAPWEPGFFPSASPLISSKRGPASAFAIGDFRTIFLHQKSRFKSKTHVRRTRGHNTEVRWTERLRRGRRYRG